MWYYVFRGFFERKCLIMKDNEKNPSNEALESVAGGKINTRNRGNRKQFMYKLLPDSAEDTMSKYNPH